jgi:tetratricopeptide (TPR) repeat protein
MQKLVRVLVSACLLLAAHACAPQAAVAPPDPELDALFASLAQAPEAAAAAEIEQRIVRRWQESGSPTVDVLMQRAALAQEQDKPALALELLHKAAELAPEFAAPWHLRAAILFDGEDPAGALAAVTETLRREPRHFQALTGLGAIFESLGRSEAALEAYEEALALHPLYLPASQAAQRLRGRSGGSAS